MNKDNLYPYPPIVSRDAHDVSAALGAFRRLYEYARSKNDAALIVFTAYKALQTAERSANSSVSLPRWVSDGIWLALQTYIMNLKHPTGGKKHQRNTFRIALRRLLRDYQRWYEVHTYMEEKGKNLDPATHDLAREGAGKRTLEDAYRKIQGLLDQANAQPLRDDKDEPLPDATPRDLVPTSRLKEVMGKL